MNSSILPRAAISHRPVVASAFRFSPHSLSRFLLSSALPRDNELLHRGGRLGLSSSTSQHNDCSCKVAASSFGGWDDLLFRSPGDSSRDLLVSLGIGDKRNLFSFLLGVSIAFAVSRVRIASIIVIPASAFVFAAGFLFGFFHTGPSQEFKTNATIRGSNDEVSRIYRANYKILVEFMDSFDAKAVELKRNILNSISHGVIELRSLKGYVSSIESMESSLSELRDVLDGTILALENSGGMAVENLRKRTGHSNPIGAVCKAFLQPLSGFFREKADNSDVKEVKEKKKITPNRADVIVEDHSRNQKNTAPGKKDFNSFVISNNGEGAGISNAIGDEYQPDIDGEKVYQRNKYNGGIKHGFTDRFTRKFTFSEEFSVQNDGFSYRDNNNGMFNDDKSFDAVDFGKPFSHVEASPSFVRRKMTQKSSSAFTSSVLRILEDDESYHFKSGEGIESYDFVGIEDKDNETVSSSRISDDQLFNQCLTEAKNLFSQAKMCMNDRHDENHTEFLLNQSAKLLTDAVTMKPKSLLAVGQLGNTYLLHGELKLRISRELRSFISTRANQSLKRDSRILEGRHDRVINKDKLVSNLANVCEECYELLVEAGRTYKFALSIDGDDVRALYNWGLALSFRAQLIADIGPEAALDADKLFLAAIDKFDAMMSRTNAYAPDALFRWGMTLQQRSRLRPSHSKERVKLLQQAMRLYEDSMNMDNGERSQVREALQSCAYELNYRLP